MQDVKTVMSALSGAGMAGGGGGVAKMKRYS
jgi:hypothetical protein